MPQQELIDQYVDRGSFRSDTDFILSNLKEVLDQYKQLSGTKVKLSGASATSDVINQTKKLNDELIKNAKLSEIAAKNALAEAKAKKEIALASKAEAQARKENAAAQQKEEQAAANAEKRRAKEQQDLGVVVNYYAQYSKAAREASLKAKNYALSLGEEADATKAAIKTAKEMNDTLKRIDALVGQHTRNVGNYSSAFDGLGMSFTQVARELPSLTISVQQFALAISNNLPILADELGKAKKEIAALKAEGQETPTLFQRIASSAISFQVILSIGIAVITAYAGKIAEMITVMFDSDAAALKRAKTQADLNDKIQEGTKIWDDYLDALSRNSGTTDRTLDVNIKLAKARGDDPEKIAKLELEKAKSDFYKAQEAFNQTLTDPNSGDKIGAGEAALERLGKVLGSSRYDYSDYVARAKYNLQVLGKEQTEKEKQTEALLKKQFEFDKSQYETQKKVVEGFYDAGLELEVKDTELKKIQSEQRISFFADELKYRADILRKLSEVEEAPVATRLTALKEAKANEKAVLDGQYQDALIAAKGSSKKIFEATREYNFQRKKLNEEYERDVIAIKESGIVRQRELDQEANELFKADSERWLMEREQREQKAFETRKNYIQEGLDYQLLSIDKERNAKIKGADGDKERQRIEKEYNDKRKKAEIDANIAIAQSALDLAQAKLKIANQGTDKNAISVLEEQIASLKEQLEKLKGAKIDIDIDDTKTKLEKLKRVFQEISNKVNDAFSSVGSLITANLDAQKAALQDQIDLIDKKKEKEIDAINASAATQQEKAEQIAVVNARAAAQKDQIEQRQRQLDLQRARFEKARAITQAVLKTAVAVVEGLLQGGPVLAAVYGAIGAAEIAAAVATPLPKFKHGREGGPATWAITGDGGVPEVVASPDLSQSYVTPSTDTLTYLPKDWKVFSDVDSFNDAAMKMAHGPVHVPAPTNSSDALLYAMMRGMTGIQTAVMNKQETHFHWNDGQLQKAIRNGANWLRYIQNI